MTLWFGVEDMLQLRIYPLCRLATGSCGHQATGFCFLWNKFLLTEGLELGVATAVSGAQQTFTSRTDNAFLQPETGQPIATLV